MRTHSWCMMSDYSLDEMIDVQYCEDSESVFKKSTCQDIETKPRLCNKEWVKHLCPSWCNQPNTEEEDCCTDYKGTFRMGGKQRTCDIVLRRSNLCERKPWVRDLCSISCGICIEAVTTDIEEEAEEGAFVETVISNKNLPNTAPTQPLRETVKEEEDIFVRTITNNTAPADSLEEEDTFIGTIMNNVFKTAPTQPLQATVNMFGPSSISSYSDCDQFKSDLFNFTSMLVNDVIADNAQLHDYLYTHNREFLPMAFDDAAPVAAALDRGHVGEDSYETNVQVDGVDEADIVKSTKEIVYAAYGDKLVVWKAKTLELLSITTMPSERGERRKLSSVFFPHRRQASIRAILLHKDRVAVIVSHDQLFYPYRFESHNRTILQNYGALSLRLYDTSRMPDDKSALKLIAVKRLQGSYVDARLIKNVAHVITTTQVDTYFHLTRHFSRYTNSLLYGNMTASQYTMYAKSYATNVIIPTFVDKFMEDANLGNQCSDMLQMTMFHAFDTNSTEPQKIFDSPRHYMMNGYAQATTFDMQGNHDTDINCTSTSMLLPSTYNTQIYASTDKLVLATRGHRIHSNGTGWTEHTFVQVLSIDEYGTKGNSTFDVPGYLFNQYAIDLWDNHLRLATTTSAKWGCVEDQEPSLTSTDLRIFRPCNRTLIVDSENYIHVLRLPTDQSEKMLTRVGYLDNLGKVGERIEAVRFMRDKAFVVTFLRTDPFYTIDLSNHSSPRQVGALEITGFSNYLHPFDDEGNIIIGVGQDADDLGRATGLQISLFNATNFSNVTLISRFSVENEAGFNETNVWSTSAAQYEPKAFRFLRKSKQLILPISIRDYKNFANNFDGFLVFDLSNQDIEFSFNISHVNQQQIFSFCWYNAYLQSRSLVHAGVVTTMKGHSVLAHDLNTKNMTVAPLNLDRNNTECGSGGYWLE